jgi:hypothetical protein
VIHLDHNRSVEEIVTAGDPGRRSEVIAVSAIAAIEAQEDRKMGAR